MVESQLDENEALDNEQFVEEMFEQSVGNMNEQDFMFEAASDSKIKSTMNPGISDESDMKLAEQFESDLSRLRGE